MWGRLLLNGTWTWRFRPATALLTPALLLISCAPQPHRAPTPPLSCGAEITMDCLPSKEPPHVDVAPLENAKPR